MHCWEFGRVQRHRRSVGDLYPRISCTIHSTLEVRQIVAASSLGVSVFQLRRRDISYREYPLESWGQVSKRKIRSRFSFREVSRCSFSCFFYTVISVHVGAILMMLYSHTFGQHRSKSASFPFCVLTIFPRRHPSWLMIAPGSQVHNRIIASD